MHMIKMKVRLIMLLLLLIISMVIANNDLPTAQTQQGVYIGRQTTVNNTNVNYWYGIPYAQQPIGNLRWFPPQPLPASNNTIYAYIPNACPQMQILIAPRTESCLTLNVYAPENANNLPVFVWIHGGSFTTGAGVRYNAVSFISASVINSIPLIVVTINYRIGLLGFLADQALYDEKSGINNRSTTGNYGILDQLMALDWIKKNIVGFGGNPQKITIGGESAGGVSVTILLTSPLVTTDTFQGAIVQSGSIWPNVGRPLASAISTSGNVLRQTVNCTTVQCLRNLTVDQILAVQDILSSASIFGIASAPVIDSYVLNDTMDNNYAKGNFQKVPILIGSNTNETTLFTCPVFNNTATTTQVEAFFYAIYNASIINEISTIYGPISSYNNSLTYLNIVFSDSWAHCGARRIASKVSRYGLPSYLYTYNYALRSSSPCFGVTHAAELPMLFPFDLSNSYPNYSLTPVEQQLSTRMILYWSNFIYSLNPNYNGKPVNWDAYYASSDGDFVLDITPQMRNHYYDATCSRLWDQYSFADNTNTSSGVKCNCKHYFFLFIFILFVPRSVFILT